MSGILANAIRGWFRRDARPDHVRDAEKHPENYFYCAGCDSGPWHNSWAEEQYPSGAVMPENPLGGCCSGAD